MALGSQGPSASIRSATTEFQMSDLAPNARRQDRATGIVTAWKGCTMRAVPSPPNGAATGRHVWRSTLTYCLTVT